MKKSATLGPQLGVGTECGLYLIHPGSLCGLLGRWRRRLDLHRLRARAILEEVAVRPLAVVQAVGTALTAARLLWRYGCGSSLVAERQQWSWLVRSSPGLPLTQWLEQPLVQAVRGCRLSVLRLWKNFLFHVACLRT